MKVFVYGTLKRGEGNHGILVRSNAKFLAECETKHPDFLMFDTGYYPAVVPYPHSEGRGTTIKGEVYEVEHLDNLDALEGYPDLYVRGQVPLSSGDNAWIYLYNHPITHLDSVPDGKWQRVVGNY